MDFEIDNVCFTVNSQLIILSRSIDGTLQMQNGAWPEAIYGDITERSCRVNMIGLLGLNDSNIADFGLDNLDVLTRKVKNLIVMMNHPNLEFEYQTNVGVNHGTISNINTFSQK